MKVSDYRPMMPIILGDMGIEPKAMPKVSEADLLAMQPASTRKLLSMSDDEHAKYSARPMPDEKDWKREIVEKNLTDEEAQQYLEWRRARKIEPYYRADKTSVIRNDNINGDYDPKTPDWKLNIAKKTAEPDHPRLAEFKQPKEEWTEVSWGKAFISWLGGEKVRRKGE